MFASSGLQEWNITQKNTHFDEGLNWKVKTKMSVTVQHCQIFPTLSNSDP